MNRVRAVVSIGITFLLIAALGPNSALAEPGDERAQPSNGPVIPWAQLGLPGNVSLVGSNKSEDLEIAVPQGTVPSALTGQIGSVVNIVSGRVDIVDASGTALASIPVPIDIASVPFTVDIAAAQVIDGSAKVSFILRESNTPTTRCSQTPSVMLTQLASSFAGAAPNPRTVADFLPGYLDRIIIRVGANPSQNVEQAALSLVARLTKMYRPMPVRIDIDASSGPANPPAGTARVIAIRESPTPGISVENGATPDAVLAVSGAGPKLLQQIDLFADRRALLAQSPFAAVSSDTQKVIKSTRTLTFAQLGMTGERSVLGLTTLYMGFDAAAFGAGAIEGAKIHLVAKYTPVSSANGSLLVRSGSTALATHPLDGSGKVDLTVEVPGHEIASNTGLVLEIRYVPQQECPPLSDRLTFMVDAGSTVTVIPGSGNRGGFPSLPMAFTPEFEVAVGDSNQLQFAAQAINLMGQQTTATLQPLVRSFDDAINSAAPLLVVGTADQLAKSGLAAPIQPGSTNAVTVNGAPVTSIDLGGPLGVIQAFTNDGRPVVAIGGTTELSLVDRSFDYIRGLDSRWASLSGDVVATGAAGTTVNLAIREGGPMAQQPAPGESWRRWALLSIALAAIATLAVILTVVVRRRRDS